MDNYKLNNMENYEVAITSKKEINVISEDYNNVILKDLDEIYVQKRILNIVGGCTVLMSMVVWIVCIISLILNCIKKNVGKAIFSGIGLIIPMIAVFMLGLGRGLYEVEETVGMAIVIFAAILVSIFGITSFIFCFSKDKRQNSKK